MIRVGLRVVRPVGRRAGAIVLAALAAFGAQCSPAQDPRKPRFVEQRVSPPRDPRSDRLCDEAAHPDSTRDPINIHCRLESLSFARGVPPGGSVLTVAAWNVNRGAAADDQIRLLTSGGRLPQPDVLLLSETDRGCERTQYRNVAADFAERLGYRSVFAPEFIELPSKRSQAASDAAVCEHGNAIVSRYPIGNARLIRFARNVSWYVPPGAAARQSRLGGRLALAADLLVAARLIRVYAVHLEAEGDSEVRTAQAQQLADDASTLAGPVIVGGDLNAVGFASDLAHGTASDGPTQIFFRARFVDAHAGRPLDERRTVTFLDGAVLDAIFVRGAAVIDRGSCTDAVCEQLSDHFLLWARIDSAAAQAGGRR